MRHWKYIYDKSKKYDYFVGKSENYIGRKGDKIVEDIINEVKYQLRVCNIYIKPNMWINSYDIEDEIRDKLKSEVFSIQQLQKILNSLRGKDEPNGKTKIARPLDTFLTDKKQKIDKNKKTKEPEIIEKVHKKEEEAAKIPEADKTDNIIHENKNKEEEKKIEPNAEENKDNGKDNTANKMFCPKKKTSENNNSKYNVLESCYINNTESYCIGNASCYYK